MGRMLITAAVLCVLTLTGAAQQQSTPRFEAASVKPNTSGQIAQSSQIGKGSVVTTNLRMRALIATAHAVRPDRIVGSPAWFDRERFDITARAPADTPDNLLRPMLRALLAERFGFMFHTEMREMPVYALIVVRGNGRSGPNLKASTQCDPDAINTLGPRTGDPALPIGKRPCTVISGFDGRGTAYITGGARPIAAVVEALQNPGLQGMVDRPVVDRTGLTGTYDFDLRFAAAAALAAAPDAPNLPSIFTAIQEQLGLKLETSRGPVEMFVIDSVERPTPD
jgi:uncharacterized protein (TIGR03435 family)